MAGTVLVRVVSDTASATRGLNDAGNAAKSMGDKFDAVGGHAAKLSGGLGDIGGALTNAFPEDSPLGKVGAQLEGLAPIVLGVAGAMDLLTLATNATMVSSIKNAAAWVASKAVMIASSVASGIATAAQWLLNIAMSANPIALVVIAIAALVAGIVFLATKTEFFQTIWSFLGEQFKNVKIIAMAVFNAIKEVVSRVVGFIAGYIQLHIRIIMTAWEIIKSVPKIVTDVFGKIIDFIKGLPDKFVELAKNVMRGLVDGISAGLQWVKDKISGLGNLIPGWLKSVLGIKSPSSVMQKIGQQTIDGLARGIAGSTGAVQRAMGDIGAVVAGADLRASAGIDIRGSGSKGSGGDTIHITINVGPTADLAEVGREIEKALVARKKTISGGLAFE